MIVKLSLFIHLTLPGQHKPEWGGQYGPNFQQNPNNINLFFIRKISKLF